MAEALLHKCERMEDLSLHILDIIENSIAAGATEIEIEITEDIQKNLLTTRIKDNGKGMDETTRKRAIDPFYTTKNTRRVGLGLSMLAQAAEEASGGLTIESELGKGTTITAHFVYDHIDRKPVGNMAETIATCLVSTNASTNIRYYHCKDGHEFVFDTKEIKRELRDVPINTPEIISILKQHIEEGLQTITKKE
jgi:anti-sigma regulatory factor (Ser/Thr protein kinase)